MSRRGRWVRGESLSLGAAPNTLNTTRIGLRTSRGLKGAVVRNRLKRQIRAILFQSKHVPIRIGLDVVIVIHPKEPIVSAQTLERELTSLCKRLKILS